MEFKSVISIFSFSAIFFLKVLSYWNLNEREFLEEVHIYELKVLSYWNLNEFIKLKSFVSNFLKVLSYWNLNV